MFPSGMFPSASFPTGSFLQRVPRLAAAGIALLWLALTPAPSPAAPLTASTGGLRLALTLTPDPPVVGNGRLTLQVLAPDDRPVADARVTFNSSMYTMNMGGPSATGASGGDGEYHAHLLFGMAGPWKVTAQVAIPGRKPVSASFRFHVLEASSFNPPAPAARSSSTSTSEMPGMETPRGSHPAGAAKPASGPGPYELSIDDSPPPIGQAEIRVGVRDRQTSQPATDGKLIVKAFMSSMPMGETWKQADPVLGHPGEFHLAWPFAMAGEWQIEAEFQGSKGTSDAAVSVSPGALAFPMWAKALLALVGAVLIASILNLARTPNGRERLRVLLQRKNRLALLVLAVVAVGSWLFVRKLTAGEIDWKKMSMQMEDYTSPTPVTVQPVRYGAVSGVLTYTGSVAPYVEDTIYPRVTGRIVQTLYPGERVTAGQVIVQLEQPDLVAKAEQAHFATTGAEHDVLEARSRVQQAQDALASALAAAQGSVGGVQEAEQSQIGAGSAVAQAQSDLQAAHDEYQAALADVDQSTAAVEQAQARLTSARADTAYWQQEIQREATLLAKGAVSQDEYQSELAKSQAAQAAVDDAQAGLSQARAGVAMARSRVRQAASKIRSVQAQVRQAVAAQGSQAAKVVQSQAAARGSRAGIANAAHGVELARHQVTHSLAMLDQARAVRAEAEANLGYLTIRAPESGVVTKRIADPGTVVSPGAGILEIAQLDRVRLQANVSTVDLDSIHVGTPVTATVQGAATPIQARVTDVFPAASETSRTAVVEAALPNPGGRLLPGSFVTMQFHTTPGRPTLMVPAAAVVSLAEASSSAARSSQPGGSGVWIAQDGAAHLVPVQPGASDGVNQEVLNGLKEGDLVIVSGIEGLTEGAPITYPGMPRVQPGSETNAPISGGTAGLVANAGSLTVRLSFTPSPPQVGEEQLEFTVSDGAGAPVKGAAVSVTSEMPSMSMSGPSGRASDNGDGTYSLPLDIDMGGDWRVTAAITPPGGSAARAVFSFKVQ